MVSDLVIVLESHHRRSVLSGALPLFFTVHAAQGNVSVDRSPCAACIDHQRIDMSVLVVPFFIGTGKRTRRIQSGSKTGVDLPDILNSPSQRSVNRMLEPAPLFEKLDDLFPGRFGLGGSDEFREVFHVIG